MRPARIRFFWHARTLALETRVSRVWPPAYRWCIYQVWNEVVPDGPPRRAAFMSLDDAKETCEAYKLR